MPALPSLRVRAQGLACLTSSGYITGMPIRPKQKCCTSKPRCKRCPIRLLAEGRLDPDEARKIFAKGKNKKALKKSNLKKNQLPAAA